MATDEDRAAVEGWVAKRMPDIRPTAKRRQSDISDMLGFLDDPVEGGRHYSFQGAANRRLVLRRNYPEFAARLEQRRQEIKAAAQENA